MSKILTTVSLTVVLLAGGTAHAQDVDPGYQRTQEQADDFYESGEYGKAYRKYRHLAKIGDSFAQYRVSTMNLYGHGMSKDPVEAFAWSVLAAQNRNPDLVQYRDLLFEALPADDREDAQETAEKYMSRYGNLALAERARRNARRQLSGCTGSRLSTRCEEVYVADMQMFTNGPGNGKDDERTFGLDTPARPSASTGTAGVEIGSVGGGAMRDAEYYKGLRTAVRQLDHYIAQYPTGNVELGEFELLDDPPRTSGDEDGG